MLFTSSTKGPDGVLHSRRPQPGEAHGSLLALCACTHPSDLNRCHVIGHTACTWHLRQLGIATSPNKAVGLATLSLCSGRCAAACAPPPSTRSSTFTPLLHGYSVAIATMSRPPRVCTTRKPLPQLPASSHSRRARHAQENKPASCMGLGFGSDACRSSHSKPRLTT